MTKVSAWAKVKPKEVPNSIILPNSESAVLVKPLPPPTLINSKTKTATSAPIANKKGVKKVIIILNYSLSILYK